MDGDPVGATGQTGLRAVRLRRSNLGRRECGRRLRTIAARHQERQTQLWMAWGIIQQQHRTKNQQQRQDHKRQQCEWPDRDMPHAGSDGTWITVAGIRRRRRPERYSPSSAASGWRVGSRATSIVSADSILSVGLIGAHTMGTHCRFGPRRYRRHRATTTHHNCRSSASAPPDLVPSRGMAINAARSPTSMIHAYFPAYQDVSRSQR